MQQLQNEKTLHDAYTSFHQLLFPPPSSLLCVLLATVPEPCDSNPCQNGATCGNAGTDYICLCAPSFFGKECHIKLISKSTEA